MVLDQAFRCSSGQQVQRQQHVQRLLWPSKERCYQSGPLRDDKEGQKQSALTGLISLGEQATAALLNEGTLFPSSLISVALG